LRKLTFPVATLRNTTSLQTYWIQITQNISASWLRQIKSYRKKDLNYSGYFKSKLLQKLSSQLIGPTEMTEFNCDNYKDHLELLFEISQLIEADKVLIKDIELSLKPFSQKHTTYYE
jgi:hypothetical protein